MHYPSLMHYPKLHFTLSYILLPKKTTYSKERFEFLIIGFLINLTLRTGKPQIPTRRRYWKVDIVWLHSKAFVVNNTNIT